MNKKFILFFITSICFLGLSSFIANGDPITDLLKKLDEYTKKYPQEKVHLHLDKPYYAAGDDIWFKAYIVDSRSSVLSSISNILYVELIDENNRVQKQAKLKVLSGVAWGDFMLADTLDEGNYRIRAYTQYMRNAGPNFFFDKEIKIGNSWTNTVFIKSKYRVEKTASLEKTTNTLSFADKSGKPYVGNSVSYQLQLGDKKVATGKLTTDNKGEINIPLGNVQLTGPASGRIIATITTPNKLQVTKSIPLKTASVATTDVQFLPEGGSMVAGIPTRIAIKAVNAIGLGENVSGIIIDNDNKDTVRFETTHLGMGSIFFTPTIGKTYTALIKLANGGEQRIKLPQVEKSGYALAINNIDSVKLSIRVSLSPELVNKGELTLVGQRNGEVYFNTKVQTAKPISSIVVDKTDFVSGIIQFTLFGPNNEPVCERLAFINNSNDKINFEVRGLKPSYGKRESLGLELTSLNNGLPVQGSFSVAVTNSSTVVPDPENETNILTSLLMTGDLVGPVERPNYYFLNNDERTRTELDNLMLTQGWRKIDWNSIADNVPPVTIFQPEKGLWISGVATTALAKPIPMGKINLFSNSNGNLFSVDTLTNEKGRFKFGPLDFTDGTSFLINLSEEKNKDNVKFVLDSTAAQLVTKNGNNTDLEIEVNEQLKNYLDQSNQYFEELTKQGRLQKTIELKQIDIIEKKKEAVQRGLVRESKADIVKVINHEEAPMNLTDYIPRIPGLFTDGTNIFTRSHGSAIGGVNPQAKMLIILDGVTQGNFDASSYSTSDIEKIEVLTSPSNLVIYGSRAGPGVVQITSRTGNLDDGGANRKKSPNSFTPKGYLVNRKFYSPKYDVDKDETTDLRTTVYWAPNLISTKDGKFNFNYFNTDQPGNYRIVIEGIDDLGNLARKTYEYKIN